MKLTRRLVPETSTLQAFECAARHGSVTKAAIELSLSQSSVSRRIQDLESRLGVLLFKRIRQRLILSPKGIELLPKVRAILSQTEEAILAAISSTGSERSVSLAVVPTFGSKWIIPRLGGFLAENPGTRFYITSRSGPFDFSGSDFDLAIHYGRPSWAQAHCTYLCAEHFVPVAAPALVRKLGSNVSTIPGDRLLHLSTRPRLWHQWSTQFNIPLDDPFRGDRFDHYSMVMEAAISGIGFALLPRYLIENELSANRLVVVIDQSLTTDNKYFVVVPESARQNATASLFIEWIVREAKHFEG